MLAAMCNLPIAITMLLDEGADIQSTDLDGNTALHLAYCCSASAAVSVLEARLADETAVNAIGRVPLECAGCVHKFKPICKV